MDKNKIIQSATKFVQKGQFDKAIKEYQRIIDEDPRDIRILLKVGELHQKRGDNKEAAATLLRVAEAYSNDGFFLKAAAVYKQVLKLNPALLDVNLRLAELYQQLGLMSDAMQQYQLVAATYEKQGNARASLGLLKKLVDLEPDNAGSRVRLAEAYSNEGMTQEAIAELGKVAEQLKQNGRNDEFVKVAERLLFLDATNVQLTRELANLYLARGDTKRALAKLQLCFKANPQDIDTLVLLAQTFLELGQSGKTVSVYKELAKIYDEAGRHEEEMATWRRVLALVPNDPDALAATGNTGPGQPVDEEPAFEEVEPEAEPQAVVEVRTQVVAQGRTASAPPARPTAARDPRSADVQKLLTETDVYLKYGLHEKAADHLKRILVAAPTSIPAHQKAKELHLLTGDTRAAAEALARCAQLALTEGDHHTAKHFLDELYSLHPQHPQLRPLLTALGQLPEVPEVDTSDAVLLEAAEVDPDDERTSLTQAAELVDDSAELLVDSADELADQAVVLVEGSDSEASDASLVDEADVSAASELVEEDLVDDSAEMDRAALAAVVESEPTVPPLPTKSAPPLRTSPHGQREDFDATETYTVPANLRLPEARRVPGRAVTNPRILIPAPPPEIASREEDPGELGEAEFFIEQGLFDDAEESLATLRGLAAGRPGLRARVAELEGRLRALRGPPASFAEDSGEATGPSFDLAAELADEIAKTGPASSSSDDFQYSVEDVLSEFKKGVARVVKPEDVDTHYDLGIAYNEMGLIDEAISEFQIALNGAEGKAKEVDCLAMLGTCLSNKGEFARAIATFERALRSRFLKPEGRLNNHFEIGVAREASGDLAGALEAFEKVARVDAGYRGVAEALDRLRAAAPARTNALARGQTNGRLGLQAQEDDAETTRAGAEGGRSGKVGYI